MIFSGDKHMALSFDVYWSFRSPYCYLLAQRLMNFERDYHVRCNVKIVYPIAVRIPGFFKTLNPLYWPYFLRDIKRVADQEGLPFAWPKPDPIVIHMPSGEVPAYQPYIKRLTHLGVAAANHDKGLQFACELSTAIFGGTPGWDEGDHLSHASSRAGLVLTELDREIDADPLRHEDIVARNQVDQMKAGHWGVPLMAFNGEPFFGQDRLPALQWRMSQHGLTARGR
jgi:2-hydroxychromene-2-carboxylate isomerase